MIERLLASTSICGAHDVHEHARTFVEENFFASIEEAEVQFEFRNYFLSPAKAIKTEEDDMADRKTAKSRCEYESSFQK